MSDLRLKERFLELVKFEQEHLELLERNLTEMKNSNRWIFEVPDSLE